MNPLQHNRRAWNGPALQACVWSIPVDGATIAQARAGTWQVVLTPRLPVPRAWFGEVRGRRILCLASGGGQQAPVLSAAGAQVVSFDLSEAQLAKDQAVAQREQLPLQCVQGDMANLSCFADASFDLVFHPASNVFVPDVLPVWRECHRVLRSGGVLLAGFMNPALFMFDHDHDHDHDQADEAGVLTVRHALPYSDLQSLAPAALQHKVDQGEPTGDSHADQARQHHGA